MCHVGDSNHADDFMLIFVTLAIIGGKLCIGDSDHTDGPMSILHPALKIIGCKLCIVVCW